MGRRMKRKEESGEGEVVVSPVSACRPIVIWRHFPEFIIGEGLVLFMREEATLKGYVHSSVGQFVSP